MVNKIGAPRAAHTQAAMDEVDAWLIANRGPHAVGEIRQGTGILTPEHRVNTALANLLREHKVKKAKRNMWETAAPQVTESAPVPVVARGSHTVHAITHGSVVEARESVESAAESLRLGVEREAGTNAGVARKMAIIADALELAGVALKGLTFGYMVGQGDSPQPHED